MNGFFAVLIAVALVGINVLLYRMNRATPVPEGCENLKPDCSACGIRDCAVRSQMIGERDK